MTATACTSIGAGLGAAATCPNCGNGRTRDVNSLKASSSSVVAAAFFANLHAKSYGTDENNRVCGNCAWRLRVAIERKRTVFPTISCGPWSAGAARAVACRPWRRATPRNRTRSLRLQYLQTGRAHTTRSDLTYVPFAYCPSMRRGRCQPRSCSAAERVGPCTDSSSV